MLSDSAKLQCVGCLGFALLLVLSSTGPASAQSLEPRSICGVSDDRVPVSSADSCTVRILATDGGWASGFMIDDNWMLTAAHVVDLSFQMIPPWTVEANVPPSSAGGVIQAAAPQDRFVIPDPKDPATVAIGSRFLRGYDWALVFVPDNAIRSPGEGCNPTFYCGYDNGSDAETLSVRGFGVDSNDPVNNGVLQTDSGPASVGGGNPFEFRYVLDTEGRNSGSPVTDSLGRIVGIHGFASCGAGGGDNAGNLISNPALLRAVLDRTGQALCADADADGLADDFESLIGTDPSSGDSDTDGDSDLVEFIASADPLDPTIDLSPSVTETANGDVELRFSSTVGISYDVLFAETLAQSVPGTISAVYPTLNAIESIVATDTTTSVVDNGDTTGSSPSTVDQRLYALQVSTPHPLTVTGNPVGFVRRQLPEAKSALIGMPFVPDDDSVNAILGDQLDGGPTPFSGDHIRRYSPALGRFEIAYLLDGTGTPSDGTFLAYGGGGDPSELTLGCGDALLVDNRAAAQNLFLAGRVNQASAFTRVMPPGYSMFAPCFSVSEVDNNDTGLVLAGAHSGGISFSADRILRFDEGFQFFVGQYLSNAGGPSPDDWSWVPDINAPPQYIPAWIFGLTAGDGYFFRNRGSELLIWTELRPYEPAPLLP